MVGRVIELEEEIARSIPSTEFDEATALALYHGSHIAVEFPNLLNDQCYVLRSQGYVGQIPVAEDSILIRISPKVPILNLFRMLEYAYDLKSFLLLEGKTTVDSLDDLFEILAAILAKRVLDRARKGLYCDYIIDEEALPYIRGQIKVMPSLRAAMRGSTRLECEYEEHTPNVDDNRILAWTLYQLPRFRLKREDVQQQVRQAYRSLASTVDVKSLEPRVCINRFYHRLNDDYRPMHGLCRFFLEHCGPGIEVGEHEFIPFVLHMPILFESFVAKWLQANLPAAIRFETQYKADLDEDGMFVFRIDLVLIDVASDRVLAVLDTKYKRKERPEEADIQQIVAYAVRMNTQKAILIYPSTDTQLVNLTVGEVNLCSLIFDIGVDPDEAGRSFLEKLMAVVKQ